MGLAEELGTSGSSRYTDELSFTLHNWQCGGYSVQFSDTPKSMFQWAKSMQSPCFMFRSYSLHA